MSSGGAEREEQHRFLILQHGYLSKQDDTFPHIRRCLFADHASSTVLALDATTRSHSGCGPGTVVVLQPTSSEGIRTNDGVFECARRFTNEIILAVHDYFSDRPAVAATAAASELVSYYTQGRPSYYRHPWPSTSAGAAATASVPANDGEADASSGAEPTACLQVDLVTHSMGGLIARAALPALQELLYRNFPRLRVHWGLFCAIACPHLGSAYMPSSLRAWAGGFASFLSQGLSDLFLRSSVVLDTLTQPAFLQRWRAFDRRVHVLVVNDDTVMPYSSGLMVPPEYRRHLGGGEELPTSDEAFPVLAASSYAELCDAGRYAFELTTLTPVLWPPSVLPAERAAAERILAGAGPFTEYLVDFRPLLEQEKLPPGLARGDAERGARQRPHRAIVCKAPCTQANAFGFVSEFIVSNLLGVK